MIQRIKKLIVVTAASFALLMPSLAVPALGGVIVSAGIKDALCDGVEGAGRAGGTNTTECTADQTVGGNTDGLRELASKIVNIFSVIIGAIAIIMLLYGGLRYITSGGDSGRVGNAKNTLLYAIIGLIIVALAQIIVNVVLGVSNQAGDDIF